ncbi:TetR/AcrR family transcriptional regulator [Aequorivita sp. SDUM287046]|uniref:TetR/AcrR family transcriptional regulator n=1 Tax=Aequorivita aurantiaca TaxID=3053356 RepID=A0ABT8DJY6_9FLAO|nr:TetR/AcrR family transcriptional regulator [Aequorivita aurantiaca]MDN3725139.1 TetR/AcrR family transcriptional regulator [Aequorivita aurantiaca]
MVYFIYICFVEGAIMKMTKSENTKQLIVEKTAVVFNTKGYAGTSMNDIMAATGLSKGCIYGNFENKDDVALAAFDYNHGKVNEHMKVKISATDNSIERLLVYPHTYKNYFRYPYLLAGCPILNTSTEADDTHPKLKERAVRALDFWKTSIENQIKRGIERKEIMEDTNPTEIAIVMISMIEGAFMQAKVTNRTKELRIAMDFLEKIIFALKT